MNQTLEQFIAIEDIDWHNDLTSDYLAEQFDPEQAYGYPELFIHGIPEEEIDYE